jgi:hypothetical protein
MRQAIKTWLPFAIVLTLAVAAAYSIGHNVYRQSLNDPQVQLAEDWAAQIEAGTDVSRLSLGPFIDPTKSLAPFGIVYNQDGSIANSSAAAPSTMAQPDGVFASVDAAINKEARFTWQPPSGARFAAVIKKAQTSDKTYYVLAARNMREVELRDNTLLLLCFIGWLVGQIVLVASLNMHVAGHVARKIRERRNN